MKKNTIKRVVFYSAVLALLFIPIAFRLAENMSESENSTQTDLVNERELRRQLEALADQTKGQSDTCPVHGTKMGMKSVDIAYGLIRPAWPQPDRDLRLDQFPFAEEEILGGCVFSESFPKKAKIFQCSLCLSNKAYWFATHPK